MGVLEVGLGARIEAPLDPVEARDELTGALSEVGLLGAFETLARRFWHGFNLLNQRHPKARPAARFGVAMPKVAGGRLPIESGHPLVLIRRSPT